MGPSQWETPASAHGKALGQKEEENGMQKDRLSHHRLQGCWKAAQGSSGIWISTTMELCGYGLVTAPLWTSVS